MVWESRAARNKSALAAAAAAAAQAAVSNSLQLKRSTHKANTAAAAARKHKQHNICLPAHKNSAPSTSVRPALRPLKLTTRPLRSHSFAHTTNCRTTSCVSAALVCWLANDAAAAADDDERRRRKTTGAN